MRMTDFPVEPQPERHPHFHAACAGDVTQVNDIAALPAEPFAEPSGNLALGLGGVAADEQVVVAWQDRGLNHKSAVDGAKGFDHQSVRELTLYLLSERICVADGERRRHPV